jgi:hypothetical protein
MSKILAVVCLFVLVLAMVSQVAEAQWGYGN